MKVLLIDIDGKLPNIALHKLAVYHASRDDEVIWNMPIFLDRVDRVYVSTIFTKSRKKVENIIGLRPDAIVGGPGTWGWFVDPETGIAPALPPEVEAIPVQINIGFTSRGCIRHCPFCIVPEIEGNIRPCGDIYDIWDGQSRDITLLDNNILALPGHFEKIANQIIKENLTVDFNQGLDIRLVNRKNIAIMKKLRFKKLRFAFDDPKMDETIIKKVAMMKEYGLRQPFFYVLVGYNTTVREDLYRLKLLKRLNCRAYVMRHEKAEGQNYYIRLAEWVNLHWTFAKYSFGRWRRIKEGRLKW